MRSCCKSSDVFGLSQDVRDACRRLAAHPGYATAMLATLALAIGVTTAVFMVMGVCAPRPDAGRRRHLRSVVAARESANAGNWSARCARRLTARRVPADRVARIAADARGVDA